MELKSENNCLADILAVNCIVMALIERAIIRESNPDYRVALRHGNKLIEQFVRVLKANTPPTCLDQVALKIAEQQTITQTIGYLRSIQVAFNEGSSAEDCRRGVEFFDTITIRLCNCWCRSLKHPGVCPDIGPGEPLRLLKNRQDRQKEAGQMISRDVQSVIRDGFFIFRIGLALTERVVKLRNPSVQHIDCDTCDTTTSTLNEASDLIGQIIAGNPPDTPLAKAIVKVAERKGSKEAQTVYLNSVWAAFGHQATEQDYENAHDLFMAATTDLFPNKP